MNFRSLDKIAKLELFAIIVLFVLSILWMRDPDGAYEPFFVFFGLVFVCTEFHRRYKVEEPEDAETIPKPDEERQKATPFIKKVKAEGVIAQCPTKTCNTIAKTTQEVEAYFGYRTMMNGKRLVQSYCRKCRSA
ncbi:hypothetical protein GU260_01990 [Vibrio cholerae]|uniref:hypothetical protein n=1 Tax=Vibrio cholerae TaxID=666 RepID=UPI00155E5B5B|nr:hypothetical protein [Vibrio cholerae]NOE76917.1 hypothetical protein [Vibrio cholerae]